MRGPDWLSDRHPYVGDGADGARRSANIDREEADGLASNDPRRDDLLRSAERWDAQAERLRRAYVDPEGPDGWIKDACPVCGAESGQRCRAATLVGWDAAQERSEPHMAREHAWSERRVREMGYGS